MLYAALRALLRHALGLYFRRMEVEPGRLGASDSERARARAMPFPYSHTKRHRSPKVAQRSPLDRFVHALDASEARRQHPDDCLGLHSSERGTDAEMRPEAEGDRLRPAPRDVEDFVLVTAGTGVPTSGLILGRR
jgi:hypothetical protein